MENAKILTEEITRLNLIIRHKNEIIKYQRIVITILILLLLGFFYHLWQKQRQIKHLSARLLNTSYVINVGTVSEKQDSAVAAKYADKENPVVAMMETVAGNRRKPEQPLTVSDYVKQLLIPVVDSLKNEGEKNEARQEQIKPEPQDKIVTLRLIVVNDSLVELYRLNDSLRIALRKEKQKLDNQFLTVKEIQDTATGITLVEFDARLNAKAMSARQWYFFKLIPGPNHTWVEISSPFPGVLINGKKTYKVDAGQPSDGFRLSVNANLNPITGTHRFGLGAQYDFGKAQLNTNYLYDPATRRWYWTVSARRNILKVKF